VRRQEGLCGAGGRRETFLEEIVVETSIMDEAVKGREKIDKVHHVANDTRRDLNPVRSREKRFSLYPDSERK